MNKAIIKCPHCGKSNRVPAVAEGRPRCGSCHRELPWVVEAGDDDFGEIAERSGVPVLVDFWATWCGPCQFMLPIFDKLAKKYGQKVTFGRLNVDDNQGVAMRYDVYAIPTFIMFMNGKAVDRAVGAVGEKGLEGLLQKYQ